MRAVDDDGSRLLVGDEPIEVWDVSTAKRIAAFDGHDGASRFAMFSPTGNTVLSTGTDSAVREWRADNGQQVWAYPGVGNGRVSATHDGLVLVSDSDDTTTAIIDRRPRGEIGVVDTCPGQVPPDSLRIADGVAVFDIRCDGDRSATTYVVDASTARLLNTMTGQQGPALAVSPDGSRVVRQEGDADSDGPLVVRDLRSGTALLELDGSAQRLKWSPDGTMIAAASGTTVTVWDATTGALLYADEPDPSRLRISDVIFSPDSAVLLANSSNGTVRSLSTTSWSIVYEGPGGYEAGFIGYTPDGSRLLASEGFMVGTGAAMAWFDIATAELVIAKEDMPEASESSVALSPDGTLIATATSDGFVRVWDGLSLDLLHEIPLGDTPIQGVAFVTNEHLAVTPEHGDLLVVTTDPDELLDIVRTSLRRGFTGLECGRFDFGDDCPTLAELGGRPPGVDDPAALNGTYETQFSADDLRAALDGPRPLRIDVPPHEQHIYVATYTMTFDDGRFDIVQNGAQPFCTGSYTIVGDRIRMLAERSAEASDPPVCFPDQTFLDATFELTDDGLRLSDALGRDPDLMLFTGKQLARHS